MNALHDEPAPTRIGAYLAASRTPLYGLAFLLPGVVFYETSLYWMRAGGEPGMPVEVGAHVLLNWCLGVFGVTGLHLPALLVVVVLVLWHVQRSRRWEVHLGYVAAMAAESLLWALPLLVLQGVPAGASDGGLWGQPAGRLVLSIGAGIYEELVFRLAGIGLGVILLVDVFRVRRGTAILIVVGLCALAFAGYHHLPPASEPFRWAAFAFRTVAGIYLGWLFLSRGFGIVVGCHCLYNVLVAGMGL